MTLIELLTRESERGPVDHDSGWASPCEGVPDAHGQVRWQPVLREPPGRLPGAHPEVEALLGTWWGKTVNARLGDEAVLIPVPWNEQEWEGVQSVVAEDMAADRLVPIAFTDSDAFFAVDPAGSVWRCEPGYPPIERVAESVSAFLAALS